MAEIKSILTSIKQMLGLTEGYEAFDGEILIHINTALSTLNQLGVGPADGLAVWDKDVEWDAFLGDDQTLNDTRSYVFLRVKMLFDSNNLTGPVLMEVRKQIEELEWRLTQKLDPPLIEPDEPDDDFDGYLILDGGGA